MKGKLLLENVSSSRDQWLALRQGKVSSSVISVIAGLNAYKSPLQLWAEWTGKVTNDFRGNDLTDLGTLLEPYVGQLYGKRTGKPVRSCDALFAHKDIDWAIATPDFWVGEDESALLETKTGTVRQLQRWAEEETPDEYLVQLQWQMGVCGVESGCIAALLGGDPSNLITREFVFDAELFSTMLELADGFLQKVKSDIPPEAGALDGGLLARLIKRDGSTYVFDEEREHLVSPYFDELVELRERKSELEAEMKKLDAQIKCNENNLKAASVASEMAFRDGRRYRVKRIEVAERVSAAYSYDRVYLLHTGRE